MTGSLWMRDRNGLIMKRSCTIWTGLLAGLLLLAGCKDFGADETENTQDTAWGIAYLTGYLFNGYIATRPAGAHDVTVQCSRGGSIRIAGRTDYDKQAALLSMDLTYAFTDAHASVVATNLAVTFHPLSGAIHQTGLIRIAGEFLQNTLASSTGLVYDVTIARSDRNDENLTGDGPYAVRDWTVTNGLNRVYHNMSGQLNGEWFSWSYCASSECLGGTNDYNYVYGEL